MNAVSHVFLQLQFLLLTFLKFGDQLEAEVLIRQNSVKCKEFPRFTFFNLVKTYEFRPLRMASICSPNYDGEIDLYYTKSSLEKSGQLNRFQRAQGYVVFGRPRKVKISKRMRLAHCETFHYFSLRRHFPKPKTSKSIMPNFRRITTNIWKY